MKALNEALLDDKLGELEQLRTWTPRVISKLESFLRIDDDWALFRANPFTFAEERGVNEDEAVDLFLYASKVGIFQLTWNLLCPGCGAAVQSFATLRSVCAVFHCYLCATDIETRLDDYVHVGFTVSPKIRSIPGHESSTLTAEDYYFRYYFTRETRASAGGPPFLDTLRKMALGLRYVEPGQTATLEATLAPGALVMLDAITNATFVFLIDAAAAGPNEPIRLKLKDGLSLPTVRSLAPGKATFLVENDSGHRASASLFFKPQAVLDEIAATAAAG
jgi:hypothetical protein